MKKNTIFIFTIILYVGTLTFTSCVSNKICHDFSNEKICCDLSKTSQVPIIHNQKQYEEHKSYAIINEQIGQIDFNLYDLIIVMPKNLPLTYKFTGTPTTMGVEWEIYNFFSINCFTDSLEIFLNCSPTIGSGTGFYWKKTPKLLIDNIECRCEKTTQQSISSNNEKQGFVGKAVNINNKPAFIYDYADSEIFYLDSLENWDEKYLNHKIILEGNLIQDEGKSVIKNWKILGIQNN